MDLGKKIEISSTGKYFCIYNNDIAKIYDYKTLELLFGLKCPYLSKVKFSKDENIVVFSGWKDTYVYRIE